MTYYTGNLTGNEPGLLPQPYYWWEAGAMWGGMVEYWHYTGDRTYNDVVAQAIFAQKSPTNDFLMPEQVYDTVCILVSPLHHEKEHLLRGMCDKGNDDQAFWGLTAITAAERNFPLPANAGSPTYIQLAENVFNDMASPRWNTTTCGGGLQWQFTPANNGFYYKSAIANGGFFQLAARLARYTGNATYSDWAEKAYDWTAAIGLMDGSGNGYVYDGTDDTQNCTIINHGQWSYNAAVYLLGSAVMANITENDYSSPWANRTQALLNGAKAMFTSPFDNATNVMYEFMCEKQNNCDTDQFSFKAYLSRWMVAASQMLPALKQQVFDMVTPSAEAAAVSCSGPDGNVCGTKWYVGSWDGTKGLGQQLSALETIQGLLVDSTQPPLVVPGS